MSRSESEAPGDTPTTGSDGLVLAVVGSREYPNEALARKLIARNLKPGMGFVSGGAKGPDTWGEEIARSVGIEPTVLKPDWKGKGKAAGLDRNTDIVEAADAVMAFWDGKSAGTKDTIDKAMARRKDLIVVKPDGSFTRIGFGNCLRQP